MTAAHDPQFYLAHADYVRALARRLVYDPHAADDLFQAAWLAALERPPRAGSAPRRWLAAVVRNLAIKSWLTAARRRSRERQVEPPPPESSPAELLAHESERQRVVAALLALEEPYRTTLIQRYFDGLGPAAIAARTGVPVASVRTRLKRGLARLRERLQRDGALGLGLMEALRLGQPGAGAAATWLARGILIMSTTKKLVTLAGLALALLGLYATVPWAAVVAPAPSVAAAAPGAAAATTAPAGTQPQAATRVAAPTPPVPDAPALGRLTVRVTWSDHTPAAGIGARVGRPGAAGFEASVRTARTDADGSFTVANLPPGPVAVELDRGVHQAGTVRAATTTTMTLTIPPGVQLRGHVHDAGGEPVAGADVVLVHGPLDIAALVVARSADDGTFVVRDAPPEHPLGVSARAAGRAPTPQQVVNGRAGATLEVDLRFAAEGGAVAGTVRDHEGRAVVGAVVVLGAEGWFMGARIGAGVMPALQCWRTETDASGGFRCLGVAPGTVPVTVVAPALAPWSGAVEVSVGATARCDVVLAPAARLAGTVRDEQGATVAQAEVRVGRHGITVLTTTSGPDGSYALDSVPLAEFPAVAKATGSGEAHATLRGVAGTTTTWDPTLLRALTLRGRVVANGRPVAGCRVDARLMLATRAPWFQDRTTDADGRFELTNCPDELLHLEVRTPGSGQFAVAVRDDVDPRAGEVVLAVDPAREPTAHQTGRVVDAQGTPVADAQLTLYPLDFRFGGGHFARSAADGRFRSPGCPPGPWRVVVEAEGFARLGTAPRELTAGATLDWGDLVLTRGGTIAAQVTADPGLDLTTVKVSLQDEYSGIAMATPERGAVTFRGIAAGSYRLVAYGPEVALRPVSVTVRDGATTDAVVPVGSGVEVRVAVCEADGSPTAALLTGALCDATGQCLESAAIVTGDQGSVWLRRLPPGTWELRLSDHRGRRATVPITVASAAVRLVATLQ